MSITGSVYQLPQLHPDAQEAVEALRARAKAHVTQADGAQEALDIHIDIPSDEESDSDSGLEDDGLVSDDDNEDEGHATLDFDP